MRRMQRAAACKNAPVMRRRSAWIEVGQVERSEWIIRRTHTVAVTNSGRQLQLQFARWPRETSVAREQCCSQWGLRLDTFHPIRIPPSTSRSESAKATGDACGRCCA